MQIAYEVHDSDEIDFFLGALLKGGRALLPYLPWVYEAGSYLWGGDAPTAENEQESLERSEEGLIDSEEAQEEGLELGEEEEVIEETEDRIFEQHDSQTPRPYSNRPRPKGFECKFCPKTNRVRYTVPGFSQKTPEEQDRIIYDFANTLMGGINYLSQPGGVAALAAGPFAPVAALMPKVTSIVGQIGKLFKKKKKSKKKRKLLQQKRAATQAARLARETEEEEWAKEELAAEQEEAQNEQEGWEDDTFSYDDACDCEGCKRNASWQRLRHNQVVR